MRALGGESAADIGHARHESVTESCLEAGWFTAAELAGLGLPGLPGDKRALNRRINAERWALRQDPAGAPLARPRAGRGGGLEFHVSLLPAAARLELARVSTASTSSGQAALDTSGPSTGSGRADAAAVGSWRWFDGQSDRVKAEAARRLAAVDEIALLEAAGLTRTAAIAAIARDRGIGKATLWSWLGLVDGVARPDRLPALAPRRHGGGKCAEIDPELWDLFKSDYLRDSAPTLAICWAKCREIARLNGLSVPSQKTFRRRFERECPAAARLLGRKGQEPLRRSVPALRRSVAEFHALELVNMDGHKFDVFAIPEGGGEPIRPIMIGIQDVMSRKLLAWRIGTSETAWLTRLVFADLFQRFGLPRKAFLDNGRAFASKWITGGARNRFRFGIRPEDPTGLLTGLGIDTTFTLPYRGQSKPIERAWKDLCDSISKSAEFDGAYTGNNPLAKPESYGRRAVPWAEFVAAVERGIAFHNALPLRTTETARGRSFDETFAASYASAPIGKATAEEMWTALLPAAQVRVDRRTGEIGLYGNRWWSPLCGELHGELLTVRFDPDDLKRPIRLYRRDGRFLGTADNWAAVGFDSVAAAKDKARLDADYKRAARAALDAQRRMEAAEVALVQRQIGADAPASLPEPAILRPHRHRGQVAAVVAASEPRTIATPAGESRVFQALRLVENQGDEG